MILISNDFWNERQIYNFGPYNVLLVIATNIAVLLMTVSVLQGHIHHVDSLMCAALRIEFSVTGGLIKKKFLML